MNRQSADWMGGDSMKDKKQILKQLDHAIDRADMDEIERELQHLSLAEPVVPKAEDALLFAARIQKIHKEKSHMNKLRKPLKIAVIAAVVAAMGVTVYAASTLNRFSFSSGNQYITMNTTENMTADEAKAFVEEDLNENIPDEANAASAKVEKLSFNTVSQAEQRLGMPLILPAEMPEMSLDSATGEIAQFGEGLETRFCWLDYSDAQDRKFGITVTRDIVKEGIPITAYTTNDMDEGSLGTYKSKSGAEYTTLTESNEAGDMTAHIATIKIGEYEYTLVFVGFDEAERHKIIDSADLSAYN